MVRNRNSLHIIALLACVLASLVSYERIVAAPAGQSVIPMLSERLGLTNAQARGAVGALLVFVREQLPKPDFDDLAKLIPNADYIMQEVRQSGIVTRPLDTLDDYEKALASLGIGQPLASQVAPAVLQALADTGHTREHNILAQALD